MCKDEKGIFNDLSILANSFGVDTESASKSMTRVIGAMRLAFVITNAEKSPNSRKRKAYVIYHRTKSKRIKKKQLARMEG